MRDCRGRGSPKGIAIRGGQPSWASSTYATSGRTSNPNRQSRTGMNISATCDISRKRPEKRKWPLISWVTTIASPGRDKTKAIQSFSLTVDILAKPQGQSQSCSLQGRRSDSAVLFVNAGSCLTHVSPRQSSPLPIVWACSAQLKQYKHLRLATNGP